MNTLTLWVLVSVASPGTSTYDISYSPTMTTMAECEVFKTQVSQLVKETRGGVFNGKCIPIKTSQKQ